MSTTNEAQRQELDSTLQVVNDKEAKPQSRGSESKQGGSKSMESSPGKKRARSVIPSPGTTAGRADTSNKIQDEAAVKPNPSTAYPTTNSKTQPPRVVADKNHGQTHRDDDDIGWQDVDNFFFRRTGLEGCRLGGLLRICVALLLLWDRYIWTQQGIGNSFSGGSALSSTSLWQHMFHIYGYSWSEI